MARGDRKHNATLDNVIAEHCLEKSNVDLFFDDLSSRGAPASQDEALDMAFDVVKAKPNQFLCQGNPVPDHRFKDLLRVQKKGRTYLSADTLAKLGLWKARTMEDLGTHSAALLVVLASNGEVEVELGHPDRQPVVWAAEEKEALAFLGQPSRSARDLIDVLGLESYTSEKECVMLAYDRGAVWRSLHVPTTLDAIGLAQFRPVVDCKSETGETQPLTSGHVSGLSEAVHRPCIIRVEKLDMASLP